MAEIDLLIEQIELGDNPKPDAADRLPPSRPGPTVTALGDLWLLGPHRLLCGNALDPNADNTLMQGSTSDMVFTDPPYNVAIAGHASGLGATTHREFAWLDLRRLNAQPTATLTIEAQAQRERSRP